MRTGIVSLLFALVLTACGSAETAQVSAAASHREPAGVAALTTGPWVRIGTVFYRGGNDYQRIALQPMDVREVALEANSNCAPRVLAMVASVDTLSPWQPNARVALRLTQQWRNGFNVAASFHFEGVALPPTLIINGLELSLAQATPFVTNCAIAVYGRR